MALKERKIVLWILAGITIITSCGEQIQDQNTSTTEITIPDSYKISAGFNLLQSTCFSCHSPNASANSTIAPLMSAIKKHYISEETSFDEFHHDFSTFLKNPSAENAKIPDAIESYGAMPKMNVNNAEIEKMALYIYHTELEKSDWFEKHYPKEKEKHSQNAQKMTPLEIGKKMAMQTKSTLGSNLKKAINTKGTEGALAFCSTRAIPLTDSMAVLLNASIKRVSDKNRNPDNEANPSEMAYIHAAKKALENNQEIKAKLTKTDTGYTAYYPILTNKMCLQCHGNPTQDIVPKVYSKIAQLYPKDKAIGYQSDELRGIWVVEMKDE